MKTSLLKNDFLLKKIFRGFTGPFALFSDSHVFPLIAEPLSKRLTKLGFKVENFTFEAGESSKCRFVKEQLEDRLFEKGFGKDALFIAVGGGVVTDLVGFLAATFCRGVPLILVPTTLVGMVDAAIGGKTALNTPYGKNLIGAIYQPKTVVIDREVLSTLPQKEFLNGLAECIKHGALLNVPLFSFLEQNVTAICEREPHTLDTLIFESCQTKWKIVAEDPHESGKRRLLNFGHTIGHALELLSDYKIAHGEAVAYGMALESRLFVELQKMKPAAYERLFCLLSRYALLPKQPTYPFEAWIKAMALDKKSQQGSPRFAGINAIGKPLPFRGAYCSEVPRELLRKFL